MQDAGSDRYQECRREVSVGLVSLGKASVGLVSWERRLVALGKAPNPMRRKSVLISTYV